MQNLQNFLTNQTKEMTPINQLSNVPGTSKKNNSENYECNLCQDAKFVRVNLPIDDTEFGKAVPCECSTNQTDEEAVLKLLEFSRINNLDALDFQTIRKDNLLPKVQSEVLIKDIEKFMSNNQAFLLIQGSSGSGKTIFSSAIANEFIAMKTPVLFYSSNELFEEMFVSIDKDKEKYNNYLNKLKNVNVLIIDDLVLDHVSKWAMEQFAQVIIYRFDHNMKTIINYINLASDLDERIFTRFQDEEKSDRMKLDNLSVEHFSSIGAMTQKQIQEYKFDNFNPIGHGLNGEAKNNLNDALNLSKSWAENPEGWLVFIGKPGCGKTHLAAAICNHLIKNNQVVCFAGVPDLLDELRSSYSDKNDNNFDHSFKKIMNANLLVLDDLGAHQISPWVEEKLYQLFNFRYIRKLPTVITRNSDNVDLDIRIKSRLSDLKLATNFEIIAPDYRIGSTK
ncbi:MAG: ATP-binding protein [Dehalococcoidia bacterium]